MDEGLVTQLLPAKPARAGLAAFCEHEFRADGRAANAAPSSGLRASRRRPRSSRSDLPTRLSRVDGAIRTAARTDDRAVSLLLFAALWLLVFALMVVGQWRRMELDSRTDVGEWGEQ